MKGDSENSYDHKHIEQKWQEQWEKDGIYTVENTVEGKKNFYELVEFTYPSGNLHVGHWYAFSVPDIHARFKRMQGFNVLYPMGFDAFGLPAENAAIKLGADPKVLTYEQMDRMRTQLRSMGAMFDWNREVVSCDPTYYKWTQWMFNQFLKNDLVYRASTKVNWCPKDQTVLANEQVVDGCCERCGAEVVQRDQEQWMLRITKYADALIDDLDVLDWPHAIKESQKNWIGRSEGSEISFKIKTEDGDKEVKVFTTRADTLFGVTYIVLAPEHPLVESLKLKVESEENKKEIEKYIENTKKKSELDRQQSKEKTGVEIKGVRAINPANGEEVPVWIADYVLAGYGTGAVMAVPAHDERDFEFAKKYNLEIKKVIQQSKKERLFFLTKSLVSNWKEIVKDIEWNLFENWGIEFFVDDFESNKTLFQEILENGPWYFDVNGKQNLIVFKDKVFDAFYDNKEEIVSYGEGKGIAEQDLDFYKWYIKAFSECGYLTNSQQFSGLTSEEAKKKITEFVGGRFVNTYRLRDWGISRQRYWGTPIPIVYDPEGNAHPVPDEHLPWLLPTDVDHTPDGTAPLARSKELFERTEKLFGKGWTPEVETMDTFVDSSWYFYRYLDNKNNSQFASKEHREQWMPIDLYLGGPEHTTMHVLYSRFWVKALRDCGLVSENEPYTVRRNRGLILGPDGNKMSKSKGNVIDPDEIVERLGADTVRMYLAFMGPYGTTAHYPWDPNGVVGVRRFLERVWKLKEKVVDSSVEPTKQLHKAIKKITEDIEECKFNTSISQMMILANEWEKTQEVSLSEFKTFLILLAPFAPHITEELWQSLGEKESIHVASWPTYDPGFLIDETVTIAVQVNGKVRAELTIASEATKEEIESAALALPKILPHIEQGIKKVVVVPGKIVNIVV